MAQNHLEEMAFSLQEAFQRLAPQEETVRNQQTPSTRDILAAEQDMVHLQQRFGIQECLEHLPEIRNEPLEENPQVSRRKNNNHVAYNSLENPYIYYDGENDQGEHVQNSNMTTSATQTSESLDDRPECQSRDTEQNRNSSLSSSMCYGEWPTNRVLWISGPCCIGEKDSLSGLVNQDASTVMSFSSSTPTMGTRHSHSHQLGTKVEMVYSLLSMLGTHDKEDMSRTLLAMSSNQDCCIAMRQSGCLPLLVQLLHGGERDALLSSQDPHAFRWVVREARRRASQALHNIVHAHPDDKRGRREARVLRLLEQIRDYCDYLRDVEAGLVEDTPDANVDHHPGPAIAALMKLSFDEEHRHAMCQLGGLQAIAEMIQADHDVHGNTSDQYCVTMRRYAGMALTNLTFGDGTNKALLCSMKSFMRSLVAQLHSPSEDLRQVTASVLRNLSWRADSSSKQTLREVGAVTTLMKAAMEVPKESTLKSILSALWNLSAHCSMNKADICAVDGALAFLVGTLTFKSPLKTLSIVENGGGILRNISSHIAVREDYRVVLRKHKCLQTLLCHLKSPSLTVVSNACGTLWNLSARCPEDQRTLWEMGAVGMLRNLVHSKHKMISMGSSAALKNLLAAKPPGIMLELNGFHENAQQRANNASRNNTPCLHVRKQRALEAEIDQNLSETCDNIDSPKTSPTHQSGIENRFIFGTPSSLQRPQCMPYLPGRMYHSINGHIASPPYVTRSDSRDSIGSTHSEPPHYCGHRETFRIFTRSTRFLSLDRKALYGRPLEMQPAGPSFRENDIYPNSHSTLSQNQPGSLTRTYSCERKSDLGIRGNTNKTQSKLSTFSPQHKDRWEGFLKSQNDSSLPGVINGAQLSGSADSVAQSSLANFHSLHPDISSVSSQYHPAHRFQNLLYEMNDLQDESAGMREDFGDGYNKNNYSNQQLENYNIMQPTSVLVNNYVSSENGVPCTVDEKRDFCDGPKRHSAQQFLFPQNGNLQAKISQDQSSYHNFASGVIANGPVDPGHYSTHYLPESTDEHWSETNIKGWKNMDGQTLASSSSVNNQHVPLQYLSQDRPAYKHGGFATSVEPESTVKETPVLFSHYNSLDLVNEGEKQMALKEAYSSCNLETGVTEAISSSSFPDKSGDTLQTVCQLGDAKTHAAPELLHQMPSSTSLPNGPVFHPSYSELDFSTFQKARDSQDNNCNSMSWAPDSSNTEDVGNKSRILHILEQGQREDEEEQKMVRQSSSASSAGAQTSDKDSEPSTESSGDFDQDSIDPPVGAKETDKSGFQPTDSCRLQTDATNLNVHSSTSWDSSIPVKSHAVGLSQSIPHISMPLPPHLDGTPKKNSAEGSISENLYETCRMDVGNFSPHSSFVQQDTRHSFDDNIQGLSNTGSLSDENDNLSHVSHSSFSLTKGKTPLSQYAVVNQSDLKVTPEIPLSPTSFKSKLPLLTIRKSKDSRPSKSEEEQAEFHLFPDSSAKDISTFKKPPSSSHSCGFNHNWQGTSTRINGTSKKILAKNKLDIVSTKENYEGLDSTNRLSPSLTVGSLHQDSQILGNELATETPKGELRSFRDFRNQVESFSHLGSNTAIPHAAHPKEPNEQLGHHLPLSGLPTSKTQTLSTIKDNASPFTHTNYLQWYSTRKPPTLLSSNLPSRNIYRQEAHRNSVSEGAPYCFSGTGTLNFFGVESGDESLACDQSLLDECDVSGMTTESADSEDGDSKFTVRKSKGEKLSVATVQLPPEYQARQIDNKDTEGNTEKVYSSESQYLTNHEEKGKEDEHTQEKYGYQTSSTVSRTPFFLQEPNGTDFNEQANRNLLRTSHFFQNKITPSIHRTDGGATTSIPEHDQQIKTESSPTKSDEICFEAEKVAEHVAVEVEDLTDDVTHSSVSCMSDLDNVKPPSVMGDVMSLSMTSSGLSDVPSLSKNGECASISERNCVDKRWNIKRSKKGNGSHRYVPEALRRALTATLDAVKSTDTQENGHCSAGSVENLSMKSSGTSEVLDNINPPSIMDEISMTNSCASLSSISSDILESRSHSLADAPNMRSSSEMFERLNAAAAMVQVYSRELNNIMTGSMKSSYNSDNIDHVKPPSVFQDIAEVTVEDGTEVGSDTLASDAELEEELPHDDESSMPSSDTIHLQAHISLIHEDQAEGSMENLTSALDTESDSKIHKKSIRDKGSEQSKFLFSSVLSEKNLSDHKTIDLSDSTTKVVGEVAMIEEETMSLVSNESEEVFRTGRNEQTSLQPAAIRGPRIVKPVTRETIRQMQEKKNLERGVRSIRGRGASSSRATVSRTRSEPVKTKESSVISVRPTRTSALRATHNLKSTGPRPPESILSKPPIKRSSVIRTSRTSRSSSAKDSTSSETQDCSIKTSLQRSVEKKEQLENSEDGRPKPPPKQGTFTKEKPTQDVPEIPPDNLNDVCQSTNSVDLISGSGIVKSQSDHSVSHPSEKLDRNNRMLRSTGSSIVNKSTARRPSSSSSSFSRSGSNYNIRRNLSGPIYRRKTSKGNMINSPSTCSLGQHEDGSSKKMESKRSPSSLSLNGHSVSAPSSQTVSQMSLSSLSSSGISLKRSSSYRAKKEVPSKIAFLWKKSESSSSTTSPVADTDSMASTLCKNGSPPSRQRGARSDTNTTSSQVKSPEAQSPQEGLKHSSTYEKLPKDSGQSSRQVNQWAASLRSSSSSGPTDSRYTSQQGSKSTWSRPPGAWRRKKTRDSDGSTVPTKTAGGDSRATGGAPSKPLGKTSSVTRSRDSTLHSQATPAQLSKSRTFTTRNRRVVSPATTETISVWGATTSTRKQSSSSGALERDTGKVSSAKGSRSPVSGVLDSRHSHASAVVSPFNYTPSAAKKKQDSETHCQPPHSVPKTVGGRARRRNSYINSMQSEEEEQQRLDDDVEDEEEEEENESDSKDGSSGEKKSCMVTMV